MININYKKRLSKEVCVGSVKIGGTNNIVLQTMLNTNTNDTEACVNQTITVVKAGAEIVRLTTQGVKEAKNMACIKQSLLDKGCTVPLVADVHFNPLVADEALKYVEKVRINPGNYANSIEDIERKFMPFLNECKKHNTAVRIGVNHGSLNKRIMAEYGDTPEGMVASCMEFLRICKRENFFNVLVSVKASNVRVMVHTVRLMAATMDKEGINVPLHLGVTEAGDGEDGRIKSAVGIGSLLFDGIGDTIRVSLSEDPAAEIPVAKKIADFIERIANSSRFEIDDIDLYNPYEYKRRSSVAVDNFGGGQVPVVLSADDVVPEGVLECNLDSDNAIGQARLFLKENANNTAPIVFTRYYSTSDIEQLQIEAAIEFGALFIDGFGDGIKIIAPNIDKKQVENTAYGILQATRMRMTKAEYISCPGCGRTLYNLQDTIAKIKAATSHFNTLKIGIMGCIVNGPGEMADADYGYVGAGVGKISLYRGKECVVKNIPESEAVERLLELINSDKNK